MAKATVKRKNPEPQPEPPIESVKLVLTPEEAEVVYALIGSISRNDFNERMKLKGRKVRLEGRDRRLNDIYGALNPFAKTVFDFL
jgi:hypothetical protein